MKIRDAEQYLRIKWESSRACIVLSLTFIIMFCIAIPLFVTFRFRQMAAQSTTRTPTVANTTTTSITTSTVSTSSSTSSTSISTTSQTTTTTEPPFISLTNSGDTIVGLYNTRAGASTGGYNGFYPAAQYPACAIDNNIATQYLNFGGTNCENCISRSPGVDTGYFVTPLIGNATIARGLLFATAADRPDRDPITVTLEGSTTSNITLLHQASSWTLLYRGVTGINGTVDAARNTYASPQIFSNAIPYASYRLLVTAQRGLENSVQYAEGRIIGYVLP